MKVKVCDTCGKERPLWKARTKTTPSACKQCASKQPQIKPVQTRTPINKVSAKQKMVLTAYRLIRRRILSVRIYCEAQLEGCTGLATDVHHIAGKIGSLMLDVDNMIVLCRDCHRYCEEHPIAAKELGLSKNRL